MKRWWVSWYAVEWVGFTYHGPWWISGYAIRGEKELATFCAAVEAETEEGAKAVIEKAHDPKPERIEWRFSNPRPDNWQPFCDRFPRGDWMRWPA